jgi:hypothetical protein
MARFGAYANVLPVRSNEVEQKDGRIVEGWHEVDLLGLLEQPGTPPAIRA